jgi:hypothetical protein
MSEQKIIDDFSDADKVTANMIFWDYRTESYIIGTFDRWEKDSFGEHAVIVADEEIHLPNLTALNGKLRQAEKGNKVKIVTLGEKKSEKSGRMYFDFDVFVKK